MGAFRQESNLNLRIVRCQGTEVTLWEDISEYKRAGVLFLFPAILSPI